MTLVRSLSIALAGALASAWPALVSSARAATPPAILEGTVTAIYNGQTPVVTFPGDVIAVEVQDFDGWLNQQLKKGFLNNDPFVKNVWLADSAVIEKGKALKNHELMDLHRWSECDLNARGEYNLFVRQQLANLRLVIDEERLGSLAPDPIDFLDKPDYTLHELIFHLDRNELNRNEWQPLLRDFKFQRPVKLTLGFKDGEGPWLYLPTDIRPAPKDKVSPLELRMVSKWNFCWALGLIALGSAVFLRLVGPTDLLRDASSPPRPGGRDGGTCHSFSLARCQMAFWFFLVAAAYLFIWLTTDRLDSINQQVLGLIGISAGTALGAAFVNGGRGPGRTLAEEAARVSDPRLTPGEQAAAANRRQRLTDQENRLRSANPFARVMDDLLTEDGAVSFHRFQMLAWTLVLGLIFVIHFLAHYALPEFSGTTLALMGISSGTYLGFKLPDAR